MSGRQIIRAEELHMQASDDKLRVIDCRFDLFAPAAGREAYDKAHIPGAVYLDLNNDLAAKQSVESGRHPLPDVDELSATLGRLGISRQAAIVVYDQSNGGMAARAWWILRWLGHDDVRLLDGGFAGWQATGLPLVNEAPDFPATRFCAEVRPEMVVSTRELHKRLTQGAPLNLVDARDADRFAGESEPIDAVAGHIPGARNMPFTASLTDEGGWKDPVDLLKLWSDMFSSDRDEEWVAMCGSGVTACHLAISAIEAGYREPRIYVGSWSEWITDPRRPLAP